MIHPPQLSGKTEYGTGIMMPINQNPPARPLLEVLGILGYAELSAFEEETLLKRILLVIL